MNFEEALGAELETINELYNKVFPLNATQGTTAPYVIYVSSEGVQDKSFQGYMNSKEIECEVNILNDHYRTLKDLTKLVLNKLTSFQGRVIGKNGPFIQSVTYEKPVELYENEVDLYRCVIELKVRI